ncbi:MAG: hydrogenase [Candidatus Riflebacteria bacterium]|nr:hydrogenase [Candidatus Riflebacteria bacterium]
MSQASQLLELLSYGVLLVAVAIVTHADLRTCIRLFGIQGFFLGFLSILVGWHTGDVHLYWVALTMIVVKGLAIPAYFEHVMRRISVGRGPERAFSTHAGLLVAAGLMLVAYHVSRTVAPATPWLTRDVLASSLATVLMGLWTMINCRKALTQMVGFLVMENGIFLFAITETYGMPLLVELGILFDVMVAAGVTGILLLRISGSFNHIDVNEMTSLKG